MNKKLSLFLTLTLSLTQSSANTGVFFGAGSRVMPIKNNDIQLKSEEVLIKLSIPENSGKFGAPMIPTAHVQADFHFHNATDKTETLQLGFPFLDDQGFGDTTKSILENLNFKVESDEKPIVAKIKEGLVEKTLDPKGLFKKVLTWEDTFDPQVIKNVRVSYDLQMSFRAIMPLNQSLTTYGREYLFMYITKTAYTWRQPVEKAVFQIDFTDFTPQLKAELRDQAPKELEIPYSPLIYLRYTMDGQFTDNKLTLTYTDKVPVEGINFTIDFIMMPAKVSDMDAYIHGLPDQHKKVLIWQEDFPYNETEILTRMLNFYKSLLSDKMSADILYGTPQSSRSSLTADKKKNYEEQMKRLSEQKFTVQFFLEDDRKEVAKIVDYLEEKLHLKKPSWFKSVYQLFLEYLGK